MTGPDPAAVSRETTGRRLFGDGYPTALEFDRLLCGEGVRRGLVGPREAERMWDRHVLNCAAIAPAFPHGAAVMDVGTGAGLPGVALAIARPDLRIVLLEPLLRRTTFLSEAVAALGLGDRVEVRRGRAEELHGQVTSDVVTARAVAPLDRLAGWCLPLVRPGGSLLAMKGARAAEELAAAADLLGRLGAADWSVEEHGVGVVEPAVRLVRVTAGAAPSETSRARSGGGPGRRMPRAAPGRRRDSR